MTTASPTTTEETTTEETIAENRRRYEALKRAGQDQAPRALPPPSPLGLPLAGPVLHVETLPGGWYWTTHLARGQALRLALDHGPASVALVAWSAADPSERLNYADTVKVQWTTALQKGRVLFSDMGRVMLSLTEDSCGAHDSLAGGSNAASNAARYPGGPHRNTRDNLVLAALKAGLDRRDIPALVSFFAPVSVGPEGRLAWNEAGCRRGDFVDLRAEMDLTVTLSNCPHPLDPAAGYAPSPVAVTRFRAPPAEADDLCRTATPEAVRGFENNARAGQ
jgi:urea carboxylase-associated protein 2